MNDTATTPSKGSAGGGKNKKQNIVPVISFFFLFCIKLIVWLFLHTVDAKI